MKTEDNLTYYVPLEVSFARKLLLLAKKHGSTPEFVMGAVVQHLYEEDTKSATKRIGTYYD